MSDQTNFITGITVPGLTSTEYAEGLNNAFNNINNNFTTLANQDFVKGDAGSSVNVEYINIFDKNDYTGIGIKLKSAIIRGYELDRDVWKDIDGVSYDKLLKTDDTKVGMIKDANGKNVSSLYFVFLDARYARSDLYDTITRVSNNSSESGSSNGQNQNPYTNAVDLSCVLIYNGQKQTFERLDNAFPTMYYTPGVGMCWKLYGENTGIPVQGLPGAKGQSSSIAIARCSKLDSNDDNQTLTGDVKDLLIDGTYVEKFNDEQLQEYDGQTVLIIGPRHDGKKNESATDFYFGALTKDHDGFKVTTAYDKPWTSYVEATAVVNLLRKINIYGSQDTNGNGEDDTNGSDNTIKIPGLFVPIHTNDDKQSAHLITATNLTGLSTDAYASDMLIAPIDDIDNINSSKTLGISDPMYVERKVSIANSIYKYDRYDDDVNKFVWKNDDPDADEKYIYTKTINPTIGDEYEIEYSMGDTAPGDSPLSSYTTTLKGFNVVEDNQKKGALCIAEDVNIVNEGDDKPHNLSVSGNVFCDAIGCVNKLTVNGGASITGGARITGGANITGLTTLNTGLNVSGGTVTNTAAKEDVAEFSAKNNSGRVAIQIASYLGLWGSGMSDTTKNTIKDTLGEKWLICGHKTHDEVWLNTYDSFSGPVLVGYNRGTTAGSGVKFGVKGNTYLGGNTYNSGTLKVGDELTVENGDTSSTGSRSVIVRRTDNNVSIRLYVEGDKGKLGRGLYDDSNKTWLFYNATPPTSKATAVDINFNGNNLTGIDKCTVASLTVSGDTTINGATTMTGVLTLKGEQYPDEDNGVDRYCLDCKNSDIIGVNSLAFNDYADGASEGILFNNGNRNTDTYSSIWVTGTADYAIPKFSRNVKRLTEGTPVNYNIYWSGASLIPHTNNSCNVGSDDYRFSVGYFYKVYASTAYYQSSDNRLKDFGDTIPVDLEKLRTLKKNYFTWKDNENKDRQIGVSAQEIQEIYPELVSANEDGMLSVAYDKLSVVALAAVDKLYEENKALEDRIKALEDKFEALLSRIYY